MANQTSELEPSMVALVSLASGIASKHPDMGLCQLDKLRHMGVPESHIETVIEIARHIRDEASQKIDASFDEKANREFKDKEEVEESCCSSTPSGQSCC